MAHIVTHPASPAHPNHVTGPDQVVRDLKASLIARGVTRDTGRTWGEFKAAVDALGVQDGDALTCIEYGVSAWGTGHILRDETDGDAIEIREV